MKDYYNVLSDELKRCNYYIDTINNIDSVNNTTVSQLIETSGYIARSKHIDIDEVYSFENNHQCFNFEEYKIATTLELHKIRDRITNNMKKAKSYRRLYNFLYTINLI